MKAKEAIKMKCPFSILEDCAAYDCMAWRVTDDTIEVEEDGEIVYVPLPPLDCDGFCSLIDKPFDR